MRVLIGSESSRAIMNIKLYFSKLCLKLISLIMTIYTGGVSKTHVKGCSTLDKNTDMWLSWYRESLAPDNHDALRLKEARLPKITGSSPQLHKRRFVSAVYIFFFGQNAF